MGSAVLEHLTELGLRAAISHTEKKIDEARLKKELRKYIEGQKKYNEICSMEEECDFQGLIEYISSEMIDDVSNRCFSSDSKKRGSARASIVTAAVYHSKADTAESQKRVEKFVSICLEIIRNFYRKDISLKDYVIATDIIDAVNENTETIVAGAVDAITQYLGESNCNGSLLSLDKAVQLAKKGEYKEIEEKFQTFLKGISVTHPLYPDFEYTFENSRLKSAPRTQDARNKYPVRFNVKGTLKNDGICPNDAFANPLDYAYRKQQRFTIRISEATKWLGDILDPIQDEAQDFVGKEVQVIPPKFPPAFPCSIGVGEKVFYNYILLRTQKILDDGTYVIGNEEQFHEGNIHVNFVIYIHPDELQKPDFNIKIRNANNKELLNYAKFINEINQKKNIHIFVLDLQKDFLAGTIDNVNLKRGLTDIEE
ncbi:MAG: hypothetical protein LUC98_08105, partial [Lachnospiraceae bacterium]|nr:hypothetical protein [Lachnospiraceae bacterium]